MESDNILHSVQVFCDVPCDEPHFDEQLKVFINSMFATLYQLGAGPAEGFALSTGEEAWTDFSANVLLKSMAKDYICTKTKIKFDPPDNSAYLQELVASADELEWRIREFVEGRFA